MLVCVFVCVCVFRFICNVGGGFGIWAKRGTLCHHGYLAMTLGAHPCLMDDACLPDSFFLCYSDCQTELDETDGHKAVI